MSPQATASLSPQSPEADLAESARRLRLLIDAVPAMLTYVDRRGRYQFCNRPYSELFSQASGDIVGRTMEEVLGVELFRQIRPFVDQAVEGQVVRYERKHRAADGRDLDLEVTFVPDADDAGAVRGFYVLTMDTTHLKSLERQLDHMARHDALTGLPNRRLFEDRLQQVALRANRSRRPYALLYLDIDGFKSVNDELGHAAGDALLVEFATRVRSGLRASDVVARLGGDEFVVILEGPVELQHAEAVAGKILEAARRPMTLGDRVVNVRSSVGLALSDPAADEGPAAVLARADAALYEAKRQGRDRLVTQARSQTQA